MSANLVNTFAKRKAYAFKTAATLEMFMKDMNEELTFLEHDALNVGLTALITIVNKNV